MNLIDKCREEDIDNAIKHISKDIKSKIHLVSTKHKDALHIHSEFMEAISGIAVLDVDVYIKIRQFEKIGEDEYVPAKEDR